MKYTELAMYNCRNSVKLLNWWKNSGLEIKYDERCIDRIDIEDDKRYVSLLNWWLKFSKETKLPIKYTKVAIDEMIQQYSADYIPFLMWWKQSGLELKYSKSSVLTLTEWGII